MLCYAGKKWGSPFAWVGEHPLTVIFLATAVTGIICMAVYPVLAQDIAITDAEALANIKLIARMEGFAAGAVAGFGFASATFMLAYKKKADQWDKFNERIAEATIAKLQ